MVTFSKAVRKVLDPGLVAKLAIHRRPLQRGAQHPHCFTFSCDRAINSAGILPEARNCSFLSQHLRRRVSVARYNEN